MHQFSLPINLVHHRLIWLRRQRPSRESLLFGCLRENAQSARGTCAGVRRERDCRKACSACPSRESICESQRESNRQTLTNNVISASYAQYIPALDWLRQRLRAHFKKPTQTSSLEIELHLNGARVSLHEPLSLQASASFRPRTISSDYTQTLYNKSPNRSPPIDLGRRIAATAYCSR